MPVEWPSPHYHVDNEAREESAPMKATIKVMPRLKVSDLKIKEITVK